MDSKKKSFTAGILALCLIFNGYQLWCVDELERELDEIEDRYSYMELQMNELEKEINEIEGEIDALGDRCDALNNYISDIDKRVSTLERNSRNISSEDEVIIFDELKEREIEALARIVEAEAGNQDYIGKCLVADVVLNRVESDIFPDGIEGVILERHYRKRDGEWCYQFSTVKYGTYDAVAGKVSAESYAAARQEYESERIDADILYFTAGYYNPCCIPAYVHGDHYFGY